MYNLHSRESRAEKYNVGCGAGGGPVCVVVGLLDGDEDWLVGHEGGDEMVERATEDLESRNNNNKKECMQDLQEKKEETTRVRGLGYTR